jgi:hypothetical protein
VNRPCRKAASVGGPVSFEDVFSLLALLLIGPVFNSLSNL